MCRTEFGKRNPINAGIKISMNMWVCLQSLDFIKKKMIKKKLNY